MNGLATLAVDGAATTNLAELIKNFTDAASTQFYGAAPAVIGAGAGLAVIIWGVPKLVSLFKRTAK